MGDSEDEYDRKRRDKFRGERAEASYRGTERAVRSREDWPERESWSRPRAREYRGSMRDRGYSPSMEPAPKRMRHDPYYPPDNYYNSYQPYHPPSHREPPAAAEGQQPPMMTFKAFLATQDDNISDSDAIEKYNDYKLEFQRQQLNEFFVAHKDDEWFRLKYHPEDSVKRKDEQMRALKKRVDVFIDLLNTGKLDNIGVDVPNTTQLVKLLDTVVIKLEGGTDADLAVLEQEEITETTEELKIKPLEKEVKPTQEADTNSSDKPKSDEASTEATENGDATKENGEKDDSIEEIKDDESKDKDHEEKDEEEIADKTDKYETEKESEEIKKTENAEEDKESNKDESETKEEIEENMEVDEKKEDEEEEKEKDPVVEEEKKDKVEKDDDEKSEKSEKNPEDEETKTEKPPKKRKRSFYGSDSNSSSDSDSDNEEKEVKEKEESKKDEEGVINDEEKKDDPENDKEKSSEEKKEEEVKKDDGPKALHKTTSIFLRNLAPTITKQEVEAMCSRYSGFLRVALADPQPERRWLRRGWVTFTRNANIKEICWNLNNIRLRDCELGAIVNRDLSRRIRPVNGITTHKTVVRSDIRISAKVALHLDTKVGLWANEEDQPQPQQTFGLVSNNPVLKNITDYLIEEASAEEEELLGLQSSTDAQDATNVIVERDDNLISVLDRIILYLRIVHSVDYYNHCEYPNEDEMPNRCGILHARGTPPLTHTDITTFVGNVIEQKMSHFLPEKPGGGNVGKNNKNENKLITLALKDVDTEIDKFVQANTRELAKDKWLCPLSGKKFKGPDFVRKHIFNKHSEKIEEVKKEVEFFNNYLKDPKRPMLEAAPAKREDQPPAYTHSSYGGGYGGYNGPPRYYNQGYNQRSRNYSRPRGGGSDFRPVIHYRDLDAPREPEEFI